MAEAQADTSRKRKTRSRFGCWPCKARKIKCGEEKPVCGNCQRVNDTCDYSVRLNWEGRSKKRFQVEASSITKSNMQRNSNYAKSSEVVIDLGTAISASRPGALDVGLTLSRPSLMSKEGSLWIADSSHSPNQKSDPIYGGDVETVLSIGQHGQRSWTTHDTIPTKVSANDDPTPPYPILPCPPPLKAFLPLPRTPKSTSTSDDTTSRTSISESVGSPRTSRSRRMEISSLLSSPVRESFDPDAVQAGTSRPSSPEAPSIYAYGYDIGEPDRDRPKNDDGEAIRDFCLFPRPIHFNPKSMRPRSLMNDADKSLAFSPGGYYSSPVPITIPAALQPLPTSLTENPMHLLYFHHFINHTARALVPHDCSLNPFRYLLPQMAIRDRYLLNLLLAYSASHRARLLGHTEPHTRIAMLMDGIFPKLQQDIVNAASHVSDSCLATAIMLASLQIISPSTFGVTIPWQTHLNVARQMVLLRESLNTSGRDNVSNFLLRWFAYLDVIGSLTDGTRRESTLPAKYWSEAYEFEKDYIDCLFGFDSRYLNNLANIAELARANDSGTVDSADLMETSMIIKDELLAGIKQSCRPCSWSDSCSTAGGEHDGSIEMVAANEAFHWAGLIQLYTRVLGKPISVNETQEAVQGIVNSLSKIRKGGSVEACILFPIFVGGEAALQDAHRHTILGRLHNCESFGFSHV
ncbi:hypothetical protein P152DRAFT_430449 [Eremomyces bilateralis CBS 781.70]|uniref:Zn(2)-C6 fungal-type domain-containing protein n=1 Tax=Eremomyces bilateralis CBS 781.70 TaxID=1392243 RepID=A0A6G1GD73_9PEZI|nr:uncharacterized protein P152DRAFT_430449 [Eremomyces bilateralis CBS 781.70]KAF1815962.1 hypothetical protein P152DRAFT_430449 [Eremomyces bilateralis CBS 781.70]